MIILFGFRTSVAVLRMLSLVCHACGVQDRRPVAHPLREHRTKFTLFFIPVFTTSVRYETQCTRCGVTTALSKPDADRMLATETRAPSS